MSARGVCSALPHFAGLSRQGWRPYYGAKDPVPDRTGRAEGATAALRKSRERTDASEVGHWERVRQALRADEGIVAGMQASLARRRTARESALRAAAERLQGDEAKLAVQLDEEIVDVRTQIRRLRASQELTSRPGYSRGICLMQVPLV